MSIYNFNFKFNSKEIEFDCPIASVLDYENKIIILLSTTDRIFNIKSSFSSKKYRNIICFDKAGNLLWEIEETVPVHPVFPMRPFSSIRIEENKLIAYSQDGYDYGVDISSGALIHIPGQRAW